MVYSGTMVKIFQLPGFRKWHESLRDGIAKARISARIDRLLLGHLGDAKPVGDGVSELRINHGPGYRLYFVQSGDVLIVLLCGGDKSTQARDIAAAKLLARDLKV